MAEELNWVPLDRYVPPADGLLDYRQCCELYFTLTGRKVQPVTWRKYVSAGYMPGPVPNSRPYRPMFSYEEVRDHILANPPIRPAPKKDAKRVANVHGRRKVSGRNPG